MTHRLWLGFAVCLALAAPAGAQVLDGIELGLKLKGYYGKGKFILGSGKYARNFQDCRARGESEEFCAALVGICFLNEQPFRGGPLASMFRGLGLNQVFKLDCGSQECFQCCHVPGQGCHTSFIGFPVINCNPRYGEGTSAAGLTVVTDPDAMPGEACLTIPQTCEHIPLCASEPPDFAALRARLDAGEDHPLTSPRAVENRAKSFAQAIAVKWCGALDDLHTGEPRDAEVASLERIRDVHEFLTGRGCEGWRAEAAAIEPVDWTAEAFAVVDAEGVVQPASSQRNALCQWGVYRALVAVPQLAERLAFVESTVWPDDVRDAYLARVDDPDAELLRFVSPVVLDLLRCVSTVYDYRLLAVPLDGEVPVEGIYDGCALGLAPRVFLDVVALGEGRVEVAIELRDPEAGGPYAAEVPLTIWWGDGRVEQIAAPAGGGEVRIEHGYDALGSRKIMVMAENTSGLRGFGAAVAAVEGAGAADGPVVVAELRLVDVEARTDTLTGNARTLWVEIEGRVGEDDHLIGRSGARQVDLFEPTALGTWVGYNTGAAPFERFTLRFHWRDGFYTGLRSVALHVGRLELHVYDTATDETVAVEVPIGPETVRVYGVGEGVDPEVPLPDRYVVDDEGAPRLVLHDREARAVRVEIDVPQALLAAQAPGPIADAVAGAASFVELRPGAFTAVGRGPDMGPPDEDGGITGGDGGALDGGADGGAGGDGGGASGCAVARPGGGAGGSAAALALGLLVALRRRRRGA